MKTKINKTKIGSAKTKTGVTKTIVLPIQISGTPTLNEDQQENAKDQMAEEMTEEHLEDPMQYLRDIYGDQEATKEAIRIAGIDIDEASEDAISQDGWQHFLARYDGNSNELESGFTYWRTN